MVLKYNKTYYVFDVIASNIINWLTPVASNNNKAGSWSFYSNKTNLRFSNHWNNKKGGFYPTKALLCIDCKADECDVMFNGICYKILVDLSTNVKTHNCNKVSEYTTCTTEYKTWRKLGYDKDGSLWRTMSYKNDMTENKDRINISESNFTNNYILNFIEYNNSFCNQI